MQRKRLGILVSGGGSNLQAIIDACESGILGGIAEVALVISNKPGVFALERAAKHGIASTVIERKGFPDAVAFNDEIIARLRQARVDLVCLAGYMTKLESNVVRAYRDRILNIHPALLPKFGGKGMYGRHVHVAVLAEGETESGATVHYVDEEYDHGPAILQGRVPVLPDDTCETLAKRVLAVEHQIYPKAIHAVIEHLNATKLRRSSQP